ncbi:MAG: ribulose-phosphate 3-epimerase [Candidatus Sericytochromatia bacterium]
MKNNYLAPSILSADFANLKEQIEIVEKAGAEWLHIDVMDGHFVPNITIGPLVVKALRKHSKMFFDVHLMIDNPDNYIKDFVDAGADGITVHFEACTHLHRTLSMIKSYGVKAGVSFNPATSMHLDSLDYIAEYLDLILIMTVNPGFGGQSFIDSMVNKISQTNEYLKSKNFNHINIEVDGGISVKNAKTVLDAGANVLVAGSSVFSQPDITNAVLELKKIMS